MEAFSVSLVAQRHLLWKKKAVQITLVTHATRAKSLFPKQSW